MAWIEKENGEKTYLITQAEYDVFLAEYKLLDTISRKMSFRLYVQQRKEKTFRGIVPEVR